MKIYPFRYRWEFHCFSTPEDLWPFISDTNRFFKDMGQLPVQQAPLSHNNKNGYKELTYDHLHRIDIWEEEPYQWEAHHRYSFCRNYKSGYYEDLMFNAELSEKKEGTRVTLQFSGHVKGIAGWLFVKRKFGSRFRRKLSKIISSYDSAAGANMFPVRHKSSIFRSEHRWAALQNKLEVLSGHPVISALLIKTLKNSDGLDISCIHPPRLARLWKQPLHDVIEVLLHAAKIDILNFSWNFSCPSCRKSIRNTRKLQEISGPLFCQDCNTDVELDLNHNIQLVFQVHPLVRKLTPKNYCVGSPQLRPHVYLHQLLHPGQKKFVNITLPEGGYRIYNDRTGISVEATVTENGMGSATLSFHAEESGKQHVELASEPNLVLQNMTDEPMLIVCEKVDWEEHSLAASHITSLQLFRNLFPREYIRNGKQIAAKNLSILFTDLLNSSRMYMDNGDEKAIGQVMDHFETLHQIILEERGAIVKTIGDAVMAIFPKPVYAVQAFERADQFFKKQNHGDPILLKGGIHSGDCVAVTLNNRIDYFGNTVNIASRLVEHANSGELVISNQACKDAGLKKFLREKRNKYSIHHFDVSLKGFENQVFEARRIALQNHSLRLVV